MINLDTATKGVTRVDTTAERILATVTGQEWYDDDEMIVFAESWLAFGPIFEMRVSTSVGQSNRETGYLWTQSPINQVHPTQYNFAGIGADNTGVAGLDFGDMETGVAGFYCHAALYMYGEIQFWPVAAQPIGHDLNSRGLLRVSDVAWADQNYYCPNGDLQGFMGVVSKSRDYNNGRWAYTSKYPRCTLQNGYAEVIVTKANEVYEGPDMSDNPYEGQIPGTIWVPSDFFETRHQPITHYFQHHTDGTNSLQWLTKTGGVSSTFLVSHDVTQPLPGAYIEYMVAQYGYDRDILNRLSADIKTLQLVRIEDVPWTTGSCNAYSNSSEWERYTSTQPDEPNDATYNELARVIHETQKYQVAQGIGNTPTNRDHIKKHLECPANTSCPGNVNLDTIVSKVAGLETGDGDRERTFPNGYVMRGEFLARYERLEQNGLVYQHEGLPISNEFVYVFSEPDGDVERTAQLFERSYWKFMPENSGDWRVEAVPANQYPIGGYVDVSQELADIRAAADSIERKTD